MSKSWLKITMFAVLIPLIMITLNGCKKKTPLAEPTASKQMQAEVNNVAQSQARQPEKEQPAEAAKQPEPNQAAKTTVVLPKAAQPAVAQSKPIEKQDEEELNPHAEDLYQMAVVESKIARKPMMSYQRMVNYCRQILELYPNTSYAPKARELLRQVPEDKRSRYHITNEEMGL